ncbi:MAG: hypothetical protein WAU86_19720 [Oricola sp.]
MPLVRDEDYWAKIGRRVFVLCVIAFAILGLLAGLAVSRNGTAVALGPLSFAGWSAVWALTGMIAVAGGLFGAVWLIIFKALAHASRG